MNCIVKDPDAVGVAYLTPASRGYNNMQAYII
jgi:hypothetical protein